MKNKLSRFPTGAVRDTQKGKECYIEAISWLALKRFAVYMKGKEEKYGRGNWKKGMPPEQYLSSLARHFQKFVSEWEYGVCEEKDDHLSAMLFNLLGLIHELEFRRFPISKHYDKIYGKKRENKKNNNR